METGLLILMMSLYISLGCPAYVCVPVWRASLGRITWQNYTFSALADGPSDAKNPGAKTVKDDWVKINQEWYYCDQDGNCLTGLHMVQGVLYFFEEDGRMLSNSVKEINGIDYSFDESGAGSCQWPYNMPLEIPPEKERTEFHKNVDAMADAVLAEILTEDMTDRQKAEAIWYWVKTNLRFNGYSPVGDWVNAANDGLLRRRGDCYTYYGTSAELLSRAGFPTIMVTRSTDNDHYWNLVKVEGGWYHFDPCPTRTGGDVMLFTDEQLADSRSHIFNHKLYPPTP